MSTKLELVCKGSYALGTACGRCPRCDRELERLYENDDISQPIHEFALAWGKNLRGERNGNAR
jgi:hypothetical protein